MTKKAAACAGSLLFCLFMPVLVLATPVPAPPQVHAGSYVVMDYNSRHILIEKDANQLVEPASLTKMMTVYVVAHEVQDGHISLDEMVSISEKAWRMPGSRMFIEVDKEVSVRDLLKGVIVQSGNDASVALAEFVSGSEDVFADMMNEHARRLGMKNTHFSNSTGLPDAKHLTTARDMAILAVALIAEFPEIYSWHSEKEFTFNGIKQHNRNQLLWRDESVDGIKTGHTESAGYCLVASALRDGMRLISVVMGTEGPKARTMATQALLNYSFRFFETHRLYSAGDKVVSARVWKGTRESVNLGVTGDIFVTVPRGEFKQLTPSIEIKSQIVAPVEKSSRQGRLRVNYGEQLLADEPLIALQAVETGTLWDRIRDEVKLFLQ